MNEMPKDEYIRLLEKYLDGLKNCSLSVQDKLNLLEFYVNDRNTLVQEKDAEIEHGTDIFKYITWAWTMYVMIHRHSPDPE